MAASCDVYFFVLIFMISSATDDSMCVVAAATASALRACFVFVIPTVFCSGIVFVRVLASGAKHAHTMRR